MTLTTKLGRYFPTGITAMATLLWAKAEAPLLTTHGYSRSLRSRVPVDENGEAVPWIPYCMVALLKQRLRGDMSVLEFGAGFSTLFFMKRVAKVTSVEHDAAWLDRLRQQVAPNVVLLHAGSASEKEYCACVGAEGRYDIILIDGFHRVACFTTALGLLGDAGVIVLDDSEREEYASIFEAALQGGFRALSLQGHKAGSAGLHSSTIFYRERNCLGI